MNSSQGSSFHRSNMSVRNDDPNLEDISEKSAENSGS